MARNKHSGVLAGFGNLSERGGAHERKIRVQHNPRIPTHTCNSSGRCSGQAAAGVGPDMQPADFRPVGDIR